MGREIKRVETGFDWPIGKKWHGYLNPHHVPQCPACEGSGYSEKARQFSAEWYGNAPFDPASTGSKPFGPNHPVVRAKARHNILYDFKTHETRDESPRDTLRIEQEVKRLAYDCFDNHWCHHLSQVDVQALVDGNRLWDLTREFVNGVGWRDLDIPVIPTAAQVNEWSLHGFGHDSCNQWICVQARCDREGADATCSECGGKGEDGNFEEISRLRDEWKCTEPPIGGWWQVWETVSEGSPVTPAFATDIELIAYLVVRGDAWDQKRGDGGWTRNNAESFVKSGWSMSGVMKDGQLYAPRNIGEISFARTIVDNEREHLLDAAIMKEQTQYIKELKGLVDTSMSAIAGSNVRLQTMIDRLESVQ